MARTTMADLIEELRGMGNAGTADFTIGTVTYWSDDQLQNVLDRRRMDIHQEMLHNEPRYIGAAEAEYYDYYSAYEWFEQTDGGSLIFVIEDAVGTDIGTALWTADYRAGRVAFASDTGGADYYLTGRIFDMNGAAADVWRKKSAHVAASSSGFDWSTDNMSMKRSQQVSQARDMVSYYEGLAWPKTAIMYRGDVDDGALK
jgi:hypothetical protein